MHCHIELIYMKTKVVVVTRKNSFIFLLSSYLHCTSKGYLSKLFVALLGRKSDEDKGYVWGLNCTYTEFQSICVALHT